MGVVEDTTRKIKTGTVLLVLVVGALYAYTKWDTSKDRTATVKVSIGDHQNRTIRANVLVTINTAQRSLETVTENQGYEDSFWVRPGEVVGLSAEIYLGKASLTCTILMDGNVVAGPVTVGPGFDATCGLQVTG